MTDKWSVVQTVLVALVVGIPAVMASTIAPLLIARQANRRQDLIAVQAAKAAQLLLESQERVAAEAREVARKAAEAAALLLAANERVSQQTAAADKQTQGQLAQIHTLVNSNLTAAMRAQTLAIAGQLSLMKEVAALNNAAGRATSEPALAEMATLAETLAVLRENLNDRMEQTAHATQIIEQTPGVSPPPTKE